MNTETTNPYALKSRLGWVNADGSMRKFGVGLLVISFVPWFVAIAVPFLALPLAQKATIAAILFGMAEVMFWVGVLIVGKEVADRYRYSFKSWLNPRYVWRKVRRIGRR